MSEQKIDLNLQMTSGATEIIRLAATILFFGGVGCLAWAIADGGHAELAGTGVTVMLAQIVKMLWAKGVITTPKKDGRDESFGATKGMLTQVADEYRAWMAKSSVLRMVLVAFAYAVGFLIVRAGVVRALTVFQNLYIAGACGAIIGAFIVAPSFLRYYADPLKKKGVLNTDALKQQPAPQSAAPAPSAEPAPTKRVVRRVKKESTDV